MLMTMELDPLSGFSDSASFTPLHRPLEYPESIYPRLRVRKCSFHHLLCNTDLPVAGQQRLALLHSLTGPDGGSGY